MNVQIENVNSQEFIDSLTDEEKKAYMFFVSLMDRSIVSVTAHQNIDYNDAVKRGIKNLIKMKHGDSFEFLSC